MVTYERIEEALRDFSDGSHRDVNFVGATARGLDALLATLAAVYTQHDVCDCDGISLDRTWPTRASSVASAVLSGGTAFLNRMQLYLDTSNATDPFIEITFWPENFTDGPDLGRRFIAWADTIAETLEATRYYARYANASWTIGDIGPTSGVFYASPMLRR